MGAGAPRPSGWPGRVGVVGVALVGLVTLGGCGVPTEDEAAPLVIESAPATPSTPEASTNVEPVRLWFVEDDQLVERPGTPGAGSVEDLLNQLAVGPPPGTAATVRSLLTDPAHGGTLLISAADQAAPPGGQVTLTATEAFGSLPADEQVLLLGQVVLTLGAAGAATVQVVDESGAPLAIPLPDGRLLDRPATTSDYAGLVRSP